MTGTELDLAPGANEWTLMLAQAEQMAKSSIVPSDYRKRPENIVTAALMGRELGWGVTTALRFIHVIEGKPTVSPEGQLALVRRAGHSVDGSSSPTEATITGTRADTGDTMTVTFTLEDAQRAGLAGKGTWAKYPQSMLWARSVSQLCRMLFSDVLLGAAYVPEEMGAVVDADGNPVLPEELQAIVDRFNLLPADVQERACEVATESNKGVTVRGPEDTDEPWWPWWDRLLTKAEEKVAAEQDPDITDAEIVDESYDREAVAAAHDAAEAAYSEAHPGEEPF